MTPVLEVHDMDGNALRSHGESSSVEKTCAVGSHCCGMQYSPGSQRQVWMLPRLLAPVAAVPGPEAEEEYR